MIVLTIISFENIDWLYENLFESKLFKFKLNYKHSHKTIRCIPNKTVNNLPFIENLIQQIFKHINYLIESEKTKVYSSFNFFHKYNTKLKST